VRRSGREPRPKRFYEAGDATTDIKEIKGPSPLPSDSSNSEGTNRKEKINLVDNGDTDTDGDIQANRGENNAVKEEKEDQRGDEQSEGESMEFHSGDIERDGRLLLAFSESTLWMKQNILFGRDPFAIGGDSKNCEHGAPKGGNCIECGRKRCLATLLNGPLGIWAKKSTELSSLWLCSSPKRQRIGDSPMGTKVPRAKTTPLRGVHRTSDSGWGAKFNKYRVNVDGSITHTDRPVIGAKREVTYIKVTKEEMQSEAEETGYVTWYTLGTDGNIRSKKLPFGEKDPTPKTLSTPREAGLAYDKALRAARPAKYTAMRNFHPDFIPAPETPQGLYFTGGMRYENPLALRPDELRKIICPMNAPKNAAQKYTVEALEAEAEALIASIPTNQKNDPGERQRRQQKNQLGRQVCTDCLSRYCPVPCGNCAHGVPKAACGECPLPSVDSLADTNENGIVKMEAPTEESHEGWEPQSSIQCSASGTSGLPSAAWLSDSPKAQTWEVRGV
jgi:hypothetical protein